MTHPEDLLADYVTGTLSQSDRHDVDVHLRSCDRCRRDIALAGAARTALSQLTAAPAPTGLGDRALADRRRPVSSGGFSSSHRWAAGAAVAAAVFLLAGVVLPQLGSPAREDAATLASGSAEPGTAQAGEDAAGSSRRVEVRDKDYSTTDVQELALGAGALADQGASSSPEPADAAFGEAAGTSYASRAALTARECLRTAYPPEEGEPLRLIDARFERTPAYIGLFRDRSGTDGAAGSVLVIVAAKRDCRVLSTTTAPG
jgi:hypothetical protein